MEKRPLAIGIVIGIAGTFLAAVAVWLTVAYTGAYNVAAADRRMDPVRWTLDTTMHRSIANRAGVVDLPGTVSDKLVAQGAEHYAASCVHCHGAPGQQPAEWLRGMRPEPPYLVEAASEWTTEEIHWIVAHGIKMTGMPAFGPHHTPEEIAAIAAFASALPGLSADDYESLTGSAESAHGDAGSHQH